jgi:hypothetical protein
MRNSLVLRENVASTVTWSQLVANLFFLVAICAGIGVMRSAVLSKVTSQAGSGPARGRCAALALYPLALLIGAASLLPTVRRPF